jgi:sucrose-6F-phosphate phosphohydrolase
VERPYLFVSDLDFTLLGNDAALQQFSQWYDKLRGSLRLAYNSGRFRPSVEQSITETALPSPDAIIGGVGTEIYLTAEQQIISDWPPNGDSWNLDVIWSVLRTHKELETQPSELQSRYKASCYGKDLPPEFIALLGEQLRAIGQEVEIIYSSLLHLDVLPRDTNKGGATARLAAHWQIPPERVIVAGDSGNDLTMFQQGFLGIVVGNGHEELKALCGERVFLAEKHHAAGVVEGLDYWFGRMS